MTQRVELSLGKHRKDTGWAAKNMTWAEFCKKCNTPHRGKEKYAEYIKLPKARQDELKDVGGFVGALLSGGNRLKKAVLYRTLLTLDVDHMTEQQGKTFWCKFTNQFDCAAVLYSTRKHTPETPRYRLVIPFAENVAPEKYPAAARMAAKILGIEQFDITTYQAERLMYWPSISSDGVFYYQQQHGGYLDVNDLLDRYVGNVKQGSGWQDISQWPTGSREGIELHKAAGMAGNPTEKNGIIGAFNSSYNIHEAIARFLPNLYIPVEGQMPGQHVRYTYAHGSTAGGLVIYDYINDANNYTEEAAFAFSHHGTDPISGKLCNAFDLVRIHKFGQLDAEAEKQAAAGTVDFLDVSKMQSQKAMLEFAGLDREVRKTVAKRRMEQADTIFKDLPDTVVGEAAEEILRNIPEERRPDTDAPMSRREKQHWINTDVEEEVSSAPDSTEDEDFDGEEWLKKLDVEKKSGIIRSTISNVVLILENDPALKGKFLLDDFKQLEMVTGKLPWRRVHKYDQWLTDRDTARMRYYLENKYGISGREKIRDAMDTVIGQNAVHPVREYLKKLQWDGKPRMDTVFIEYLGVGDTEYTRTVTRKALLACVYRIMRPGIKFDNMLVQVGEEGKGKSQILDRLGGEWFSDTMYTVQGKEAYEQIQGWWIIEMAELSAMSKAEGEAVKHFLHKRQDAYRPAFGRQIAIRPRQCVFFGTTNKKDFLKKGNGHRSFWPIHIFEDQPTRSVDDLDKDTVAQIWAEAMEAFRSGETLKLETSMFYTARRMQESHTEQDARLPDLIKYLNCEVPVDWYKMSLPERRAFIDDPHSDLYKDERDTFFVRNKVCTREVWTELMKGQLKDLDRRQSNVIIDMLESVPGWEKTDQVKIPGLDKQRGFIRKKITTNR